MLQVLSKIDAKNLRPDEAREDRGKCRQKADRLRESARSPEERDYHGQPQNHHANANQYTTVHDSECLQRALPHKRRL